MVIDKSDMLSVLESFPKQCREALSLPKGITVSGEISGIFVCGMGGSAIGGDLLASYLKDSKLAITVVRDYKLPDYVDEYSLVFVVSYSGNTEETLSCYEQALKKKAKIIVITSGGKLAKSAEKVIKIPAGLQPRAATGYLFLPMLGVLYNSGIINITNTELNEMIALLKDVESYKEKAKELAKKIGKKIPIIYSSERFKPVAYRMKTQINENAKYPCYTNTFSEMNHNEINAFQFMERSKFIVFLIRDEKDNPRIQKRMDICRDIMEERVDVEEIFSKGKSLLARMFSTIYLGDLTSYYLAINNRVDPTPVEVIEHLKKELLK